MGNPLDMGNLWQRNVLKLLPAKSANPLGDFCGSTRWRLVEYWLIIFDPLREMDVIPMTDPCIPEDPCMEHLPTLTPKVFKNNPNVGKYSIHGSLGYGIYANMTGVY